MHRDKHFAPGDAVRYAPSTVGVVLVSPLSPHQAGDEQILAAGGLILYGMYSTSAPQAPTDQPQTIRVRGTDGTVRDAISVKTKAHHRFVIWYERKDAGWVQWTAVDNEADRSLTDLVRVLDDLRES